MKVTQYAICVLLIAGTGLAVSLASKQTREYKFLSSQANFNQSVASLKGSLPALETILIIITALGLIARRNRRQSIQTKLTDTQSQKLPQTVWSKALQFSKAQHLPSTVIDRMLQ